MKTIRKLMELDVVQYHEKHLSIINSLLPVSLTPKEIEVLAAFMSLDSGLKRHMFGTTARKEVMELVGLTPGGLGNYLKSLKGKGFIVKDSQNQNYIILPILVPEEKEQDYQFKLISNGSNS